MKKCYERIELVIVDNRGERSTLLIVDEHLSAPDVISRIGDFMGAITRGADWAPNPEGQT